MTDKRLEEIRARHSLFESSRILYEEKNRHRLVSDSAVLHADIGALLDMVGALQAKLDACAKLPPAWQEDRWSTAVDARLVVKAHVADLEAALNG